jgi:hypothetical protein
MTRRAPIVAAVLAGLALIGIAGFILFTGRPAGDGSPEDDGAGQLEAAEAVPGADDSAGSAADGGAGDTPLGPQSVEELAVSTVRLLGLDADGGVLCAESGVVVTNDGAVLTTYRLAGDDPSCVYDRLGVALTYDADDPTELAYEATVEAAEGDFVVLRPSAAIGAAPWPPLPWTPAPLRFGAIPEVGQALRVLGYTEVLDTDASVRVSQTGLTVTDRTSDAYLVDGVLAPGSEGGMAVDDEGWVVGLVDVGDATRVLPIDDARPVLEAANADEPLVASLESGPAPIDVNFSAITLSSPRFSEQGEFEPGSFEEVKVATSGTDSLCLTFVWSGIPVGATWDALWYRNGVLESEQATTDATWEATDDNQVFWQCAQDPDGLKPGTWEFGFRLQGRTMFVEAIEMVGTPPELVPLEWVNETGVPLCEFAVNPVAPLDYAGLNILPSGTTFEPGKTLRYELPPGRYIVEAHDCDGELVIGVYNGLEVSSESDRLALKAG